ncbi:MAG: hypothetical protein PHN56_02995 [Candidatus Nanoarchaeia archaeon]|nr:hypothetical protein [Candidatus Nanoarchaeia archaeon]
MKLFILPLLALMMSVAFCNSAELLSNKTVDLSSVITAYSEYLQVVLPFNIGFNLTDTEELVTLSVGLNGSEVTEGIVNSSLTCKMSSGLLESLFNSGSIESVKSLLDAETVICASNGAKGEIIISALNGILGREYIVLENKGIVSQIVSAITNFFNWILAFLK